MIKKAIAVRSHSPMAIVMEVYEQKIVKKRFLFWTYESRELGEMLCAGTVGQLQTDLKDKGLSVWDVDWEKNI